MSQASGVTVATPLATSSQHEDEYLASQIQSLRLLPTNKLFTTYELVEAILLRMSTFDLCLAGSVCRYWKEVIESSKALKEYAARVRPTRAHIPPYRIRNSSGAKVWHFIVRASHGRLIVTRTADQHEAMLFVPKSTRDRLRLIDGRYAREVILSYEWIPWPEIFQWEWPRGSRTEKVVCRIKGYSCLLRRYLIATFPILRDASTGSDHGRLGIRFPFYEWKDHTRAAPEAGRDDDCAVVEEKEETPDLLDSISEVALSSPISLEENDEHLVGETSFLVDITEVF